MNSKKIILILSIALFPAIANATASHKVSGYVKKNGTYVAPHHATNQDKTETNNYSTKGNVNPHNGKEGTKKAKK